MNKAKKVNTCGIRCALSAVSGAGFALGFSCAVAAEPVDAAPTAGSAAMQVHIDPRTGRRRPPPDVDSVPAVGLGFSRSSVDLQIVDGPMGKGKMVDLKGRFRSPLTATLDNDGQLSIGHDEFPAAAHQK